MAEARTIYHYHYNAHGHALSGEILRPFRETIEVQAGMSLPTIGGYGCARVANFQLKCAVSFKSAFTQVMGSFDPEAKNHTTLVSTTIEGLNFLDVVTADRIVMRLASHFHLDNDANPPVVDNEPHITVLGSHFVNLRIAGHLAKIDFDHERFLRLDTFEEFRKELDSNEGFRKMALDPYHTGRAQALPGPCGVVLCSLVKEIDVDCPGVTRKGHVLTVPEFGKIYVAELIAEYSRRTLTMLRFELGSPGYGGGTAGSGQSNGSSYPPTP
jgi:hypothetical protein